MRKFSDEPYGVTQQKGQVVKDDFSDGSVQGGEQLVFGKNLALGHQGHQGALSGIGVSHECNAHQSTAVSALGGHLLVDGFQFFFEVRNAIANDPTVRLNFFFTWALHADASFLLLQVGPHVGEARQEVLVLGQFHLGLGVGRSCPLRKNVQN